MRRWQELRAGGLGPLQREVAVFRVGPPLERLPFASFQVKVLERADGSFGAFLNVALLGPDGAPDWLAGPGATVEEAVEDALGWLARALDWQGLLTETDFVWWDPREF